jgi:hypothetical protein
LVTHSALDMAGSTSLVFHYPRRIICCATGILFTRGAPHNPP